MKRTYILCAVVSLLAVSTAMADISRNSLLPLGRPRFGGSITQSATATPSTSQYYVGLRMVSPSDSFIESVSQLGGIVAGTNQYATIGGSSRLVEAWWVNTPPPVFTATFEVASHLGSGNPQDFVGLAVEAALADVSGTITASRQWLFTNGADPSSLDIAGQWTPWVNGWYLTDLSENGSQWSGGSVFPQVSTIPAPGAALLGVIGLCAGVPMRRRA